MYLSDL
jgi:hypothetical protein